MGGKFREQQQARQLRKQGKSLNEICRELEVAKSSVSLWVRDILIRNRARKELRSRGGRVTAAQWREYWQQHPKPIKIPPPVRESVRFFDTWTPEMAYVLGYFAADGCMYRNKRGSHYIAFYSTDKELIETVKTLTSVKNRIEVHKPLEMTGWKTKYTLQIGSRYMFERLADLGLTPNKSLTLQYPKVPDKLLGHFVRGNLDGDGNVYFGIHWRRNRPGPTKILLTRFTSGSYKFLEGMHAHIKRVTKVNSGAVYKRSESHFVLSYSTKAARQLYSFMYPTSTVPCLRRKKAVFERALKELTK